MSDCWDNERDEWRRALAVADAAATEHLQRVAATKAESTKKMKEKMMKKQEAGAPPPPSWLYLFNTQVTGTLDAISNLTSLAVLFLLSNTQLMGSLDAVSNLTSLTWLYLFNTQVMGSFDAISNLTSLTWLALAPPTTPPSSPSLKVKSRATSCLQARS